MNKCSGCKRILSRDNFHKVKTNKNGLHSYCKDCRKILDHKHYEKHKGKKIESIRNWEKKNIDKKKEYNKNALVKFRKEKRERFNELMRIGYQRNKDKFKSRGATVSVLKGINGYKKREIDLAKECKICKTKKDLEIHHEIYPFKLKGILKAIKDGKIYYLCRECHRSQPKA